MGRIRRMFTWSVENELVASAVLEGLRAVRGLQKGRTGARETKPIAPVSVDVVEQTLPFLLPPVQAIVRRQLYTGARPGEIVIMRGCDLEMGGPIWLNRPGSDRGSAPTLLSTFLSRAKQWTISTLNAEPIGNPK